LIQKPSFKTFAEIPNYLGRLGDDQGSFIKNRLFLPKMDVFDPIPADLPVVGVETGGTCPAFFHPRRPIYLSLVLKVSR
jgi:hypothetical protein